MGNKKTFWLVLAAVIIIFFVFFVSSNYNPSPQPQAAITNTSPYASVSLEAWKFSGLFNENCAVGDEPFCALYENGESKCGCRKIPLLDYKAPTSSKEDLQYKTININNKLYMYDVKDSPFCAGSNLTRATAPTAEIPFFSAQGYSALVNSGLTLISDCNTGNLQYTDLNTDLNTDPSRSTNCYCYKSDQVTEKLLGMAFGRNGPQFACPANAVLTNGEPFEVTPLPFVVSEPDPITRPDGLNLSSQFTLKATCPVTVSRFLTQSTPSTTTSTTPDDIDQLITYFTQQIADLLELRNKLFGF